MENKIGAEVSVPSEPTGNDNSKNEFHRELCKHS